MVRTSWESERDAAILAARQAGDIMLSWAGKFTTRSKGQNDLVTEADVAVQTAVRETLLRKFPKDDFLGEEESCDPATLVGSRRWIVDPIDGTTNFVHGFPYYGVSIALEVDGELVVGVILDPNHRECFVAAAGQGATCNGSRIHVSSAPTLSESLINVGLPAVPDRSPESIEGFVRLTVRSRAVRRIGSAALAMAYVACGRLDGFVAHVIQPWDIAAGVVLIREAGGRVSNLRTHQYNHYTRNILASNGLVHEELSQQS